MMTIHNINRIANVKDKWIDIQPLSGRNSRLQLGYESVKIIAGYTIKLFW